VDAVTKEVEGARVWGEYRETRRMARIGPAKESAQK
jgi:hypothetical protein